MRECQQLTTKGREGKNARECWGFPQARRKAKDYEGESWCPGAELNHRHLHFQCSALPTELPGRRTRRSAGGRARGVIKARFPAVQTSWRRCGRRRFVRKMPHAPASFVSSPRFVGAILDEVRREADKVFWPCS